MESFKSFITESKLSRIWQYVEYSDKSFGVLSSFRGQYSMKENLARHAELKKAVRGMGLGFIEMKGGYKEGDDVTEELSLFVPKVSRSQIIELGKQFEQHSVMFKDESEFVYIGTNDDSGVGKVLSKFKLSSGRDNIELAKEKVSDFFSQLKKGSHKDTKFIFNMVDDEPENTTKESPKEDSVGKSKEPGEVWQTANRAFGGKNAKGEIRYFDTARKAQDYARSRMESFSLYEKEEWNFAKAAYLNRGQQPKWIQII